MRRCWRTWLGRSSSERCRSRCRSTHPFGRGRRSSSPAYLCSAPYPRRRVVGSRPAEQSAGRRSGKTAQYPPAHHTSGPGYTIRQARMDKFFSMTFAEHGRSWRAALGSVPKMCIMLSIQRWISGAGPVAPSPRGRGDMIPGPKKLLHAALADTRGALWPGLTRIPISIRISRR